MNTEQIIKMGYEAGLCDEEGADEDCIYIHKHLTRFAELVAAVEREAIARMFEDSPPLVQFVQNDQGGCAICGFTPRIAAESIRAYK